MEKIKHHITVQTYKSRYPGMKKPSIMHRAMCDCGWISLFPRSSGELAQQDGNAHLPRKTKKENNKIVSVPDNG